MHKIKLIYNPHAGKKRPFQKPMNLALPEILGLLKKYEIPTDSFPTKKPHHAMELAKDAIKEGYEMVVVAGGDGTANEAANGLVGSGIPLGIIPMGTFMNVARMLGIPVDLEKAVAILKIKKVRKIDLGVLSRMEGKELDTPYYFIETSGIGTEAHVQFEFKKLEKGNLLSFFSLIKHAFSIVRHKIEITADGVTSEYRANFVTIANGPIGGASMNLAPDAKLDDRLLTVVVYKYDTRHKLFKNILGMFSKVRPHKSNTTTFKAKELIIKSNPKMLVHADASVFGKTPVHYKIKPSSLNVVCGFSEDAVI